MAKELKELEEGPKAEIHIYLLRMTLKKQNWKTPGHDGINEIWFKKFTTIHDRLALVMNRCLPEFHGWIGKVILRELCKKFKFKNMTIRTKGICTTQNLSQRMIYTNTSGMYIHKHLWDTNRSLNLSQTTRPCNIQQEKKKELAKLWTLLSRLTID